MLKVLAALIAATVWGCEVDVVSSDPADPACEMELVLANPGPEAGGCFRVVAGSGSCVRLPGEDACEASVEVRDAAAGYEAWACAKDWAAPTLEECEAAEVTQ